MATPFNFDPLLIAALADIDKARALLDEARAARGPGNKGLYAVVEAEAVLEEAERARDWLADVRTLVAAITTRNNPNRETRTMTSECPRELRFCLRFGSDRCVMLTVWATRAMHPIQVKDALATCLAWWTTQTDSGRTWHATHRRPHVVDLWNAVQADGTDGSLTARMVDAGILYLVVDIVPVVDPRPWDGDDPLIPEPPS
jgi:hypothetical protein